MGYTIKFFFRSLEKGANPSGYLYLLKIENLINFRNHRVGHAMNVTDQHFEEIFSNWGAIWVP